MAGIYPYCHQTPSASQFSCHVKNCFPHIGSLVTSSSLCSAFVHEGIYLFFRLWLLQNFKSVLYIFLFSFKLKAQPTLKELGVFFNKIIIKKYAPKFASTNTWTWVVQAYVHCPWLSKLGSVHCFRFTLWACKWSKVKVNSFLWQGVSHFELDQHMLYLQCNLNTCCKFMFHHLASFQHFLSEITYILNKFALLGCLWHDQALSDYFQICLIVASCDSLSLFVWADFL